MIYVGIDPGLDGAVAIISDTIQLFDSPSWTIEGKKADHREYDIRGMVEILRGAVLSVENRALIVAGLESVHSMPEQGVASAFKFGRGLGIWQGILESQGITYQMIPPQRWKKNMMDGMGKEKHASIIAAQRLFPVADIHLAKHHGRADALLLAEYMKRITNA